MLRRLLVAGCTVPAVVTLASCDDPVTAEASAPLSLSIVSGGDQTGAVGEELPDRLVVRLTQQAGRHTLPVVRHLVNFRVVSGGGSMFAGAALTDLNGLAQDYLTLGPTPGVNVVEVRSVNSTTGEKQVFATFTAIGRIRGPEVCNGEDDDLDRVVDDATWRFCIGGVPAPNTNGMNACTEGHIDANSLGPDGCEQFVTGRWTLDPVAPIVCPGTPANVGQQFDDIRGATLVALSPSTVLFQLRVVHVGQTLSEFTLQLPVAGDAFAGSTPYSFDRDIGGGTRAIGSGTMRVDGRFTSPGRFQARLQITLDLTYRNVPPTNEDVSGQCENIDATVTGIRAAT